MFKSSGDTGVINFKGLNFSNVSSAAGIIQDACTL